MNNENSTALNSVAMHRRPPSYRSRSAMDSYLSLSHSQLMNDLILLRNPLLKADIRTMFRLPSTKGGKKRDASAEETPFGTGFPRTSSGLAPSLGNTDQPKKKKNIDEFLAELKSRDALRTAAPAPEVPMVADPALASFLMSKQAENAESTNLFVGNLGASVTEEKLRTAFGAFGDIFSVKVMWPRSEDERRRNRNKGFVSFVRPF